MSDKCFCHLNGYEVKDAKNRKDLAEEIKNRQNAEADMQASILDEMQIRETADNNLHSLIVDETAQRSSDVETINKSIETTNKKITTLEQKNKTFESSISTLGNRVVSLEEEFEFFPYVNVSFFGACGDGVTDDTDAIQSAIDLACAKRCTCYIPAGDYVISDTLVIGNGDKGANASSINGFKLIGAGAGVTQNGENVATTIRYKGRTGTGSCAIELKGRITDIELKNFLLYCETSPNIGISASSFSGCTFENIRISNPAIYGLYLRGGNTVNGNYCIMNKFDRIFVALLTPNSVGINIDGDIASINDMWLSTFTNCRVESHADGCTGLYLGFQDSCTFIRCHFVTYSTNYKGVHFDATGHDGYPSGNGFYDCSIINTYVTGDIREQTFINHGTWDNEEIPTHPKLKGVTDRGIAFNGWGASS